MKPALSAMTLFKIHVKLSYIGYLYEESYTGVVSVPSIVFGIAMNNAFSEIYTDCRLIKAVFLFLHFC